MVPPWLETAPSGEPRKSSKTQLRASPAPGALAHRDHPHNERDQAVALAFGRLPRTFLSSQECQGDGCKAKGFLCRAGSSTIPTDPLPPTALRVVGVPCGGRVPQDRSISPFHPCAAPLRQATKQDKPRQWDPVGCLLRGGFPLAPGVFSLRSDPVQLHHHFRRCLSPGPAAGVLQQHL